MIRVSYFVVLFAGLLLASCAREEARPQKSILFSGQVRSGDTNSPVSNINVSVLVFGTRKGTFQSVGLQDSTRTNVVGKYEMKITYDDSVALDSYTISATGAYFLSCHGDEIDIMPWPIHFYRSADSVAVNTDTLTVCSTGNIRLNISKLNPTDADTLFYQGIPQVINFTIIGVPWEFVTNSKEVLLKLFPRTTTGMKFNFRIKKASGAITESSELINIEKGVTKEVNVEF